MGIKNNQWHVHSSNPEAKIFGRRVARDDFLQKFDMEEGESGWVQIPTGQIDRQVGAFEVYIRLAELPVVDKTS